MVWPREACKYPATPRRNLRIEPEDVSKPSDFTVGISECAFCSDGKEAKGEDCFFLGGVVAGAAQEIYKIPYKAVETSCTRNRDDSCEFALQRKEHPNGQKMT